MTTGIEPAAAQPAPPAVEEAPKNSFARMIGVLFSPDETFREIARKPDILIPLAVLLILGCGSSWLVVPHMDMATSIRDSLANSGRNLSPDDIERSVRIGIAFGKVMTYAAPLWLVGVWALFAGVLELSFRLFGAEGTYKQSFSAFLYGWIPLVLQSIISAVVAIFRGTVDPREMGGLIASTPAFFISFKDNPVLYSFLSSLDLFTIWTLVLLTIGFAYVARVSKTRSAVTVVSWWAFLVLIKVGFAAIGAARMKANG